MRALALAAVLLGGCAPAFREPPLARVECGEAHEFRYCLHTDGTGKASNTVLYYLHGGGESEKAWGKWPLADDFVRRFRERGLPAPTVITISFGKLWLLTERGASPDSGLFERFLNEAMPFVEAKTGVPRRRLLWGMSMGGFNAVQLLLKRPTLWTAGVLSCPAVTILSPSASPDQRRAFIERTRAQKSKVDWLFEQSRRAFSSAEAWDRHDPLKLALSRTPVPPLLIECGETDEWGFYEGAQRLSETLAEHGQKVRFETAPKGKHCTVDPDRVLGFLLKAGS